MFLALLLSVEKLVTEFGGSIGEPLEKFRKSMVSGYPCLWGRSMSFASSSQPYRRTNERLVHVRPFAVLQIEPGIESVATARMPRLSFRRE